LFALPATIKAQNVEKLYAKAYKTFYEEELVEAYKLFQEVMEIDASYEEAAYLSEIAYLLTQDRNKPLDRLLFLQSTQGKSDKFADYWLGRVYASRYKYELALSAWDRFLAQKVYLSKEIKAETRKWMKDAQRRMDFFDTPGKYEIKLLPQPVNSEFDDFSPSFFAGHSELLFTSNRNAEPDQLKVYHAIKNGLEWDDIRSITELEIIKELTRDNATIEVVDQDGKLFVYQEKGGNLFYSHLENEVWQPLEEFDKLIKKADIESHFFINDHEDRIIFSADNGKDRGMDLFQTYKDPETGKWSEPVEFAFNVNSAADEDSPYLSHDETRLFFSSNRDGGIGKYDIYVSVLDTVTLKWSDPAILPFPINTPDDELHFKLNPDDISGYFASDRINTHGGFDIFAFREMNKTRIEGRIYDHLAQAPLRDGRIVFIPLEYEDQYFKSYIDENGHYEMDIYSEETFRVEIIQNDTAIFTDEFTIGKTDGLATVHIKDYFLNKEAADKKNQKKSEKPPVVQADLPQEKDATNYTREEKDQIITAAKSRENTDRPMKVADLGSKYSTSDKVIIHNIYFNFGTSQLSDECNSVLSELYEVLKNRKNIKVEIAGYTDNVGNSEFNLQLSARRAESVKNWLVQQGIDPERLVTRGYGEQFPLASNDDEREGRELNRRIEVKLLEEI
jgi:outer membrane protein OmpA-like peptidoglycan-associated protein